MPSPPSDPAALSARIKELARAEGFDLCGIASARPLDPGPLDHWLARGWDAGLWYVRQSRDERLNVERVLPGARSVVSVAVSYRHPAPPAATEPVGVVARYARGRDYHNVLRRPLKRLRALIEELVPGSVGYASCDSRPVAEKAWAQEAGLGWIGKNGCLISPTHGSWLLLGCVLTTAHLAPDAPHPDRCGTCADCLSGCPTGAIPEPRFVDAGRCIAYHTIEHGDAIPPQVASRLGDRLFGCDLCQEVCPWNRREIDGPPSRLRTALTPHPGQALIPLRLLRPTSDGGADAELDRIILGTPLARAGAAGLRRTAAAIEAASCPPPETP